MMKNENSTLETQVFSSGGLNGSDESKDLGFGTEVAKRARRRLLNRDGSFNVRREGSNLRASRSLYHFCLNINWYAFFGLIFALYLGINLLFGLFYFSFGPLALDGTVGKTPLERYVECFFFSVQTFATIGYGKIAPESFAANILVTLEALIGLLGFALATGLFFARFSRPTARILFSKFAVIAPYRGITAFEFRIANQRKNQLMHLEVRVILSYFEKVGDDLRRKFHELDLERRKVMFFPLNWTVVHPINHESPLFGLSEQELAATDAEFLILLDGIDDTFSQQVHTSSSYKYDEIVWGAKFVNILDELQDGTVRIDLNRLHEIERAIPAAPAQ